MSLRPPPHEPAELEDFPVAQLRGRRLFRVFRHREPGSGAPREPFFFACAVEGPDGAPEPTGRYDLSPPEGSCYLAGTNVGAWLETFRGTLVIDRADLRARRMLATVVPRSLHAADLTAPGARRHGITAAIHTTTEYAATAAWARALRRAGLRALLGKARHDPRLETHSVTLFDDAGAHAPYGWRWRREVTDLHDDAELAVAVAAYGYMAAERPYDVRTREPGRRR